MSLANRTDSDRLDDLLEAVEKQTCAVNRLAMATQESADKPRRTIGVLWWLLAAIAGLAWLFSGLYLFDALTRNNSELVAALVAFVVIGYVLARCEEKIRGGAS